MLPHYHFTCLPHLESIIRSGAILPSESNVGAPWEDAYYPSGENAGPPVVHLLDAPSPSGFDHGLGGSGYNKKQVRIEVRVPAIPWNGWEWTHRMSPRWRENLENSGGQGASSHWLVFPAPIRQSRWLSIAITDDPPTPIPTEYEKHLDEADDSGYRTMSADLIQAIAQAQPNNVRPSL